MAKVTLGSAPKIDNDTIDSDVQFIAKANAKPIEKTSKNVNFYLPIQLIDNLDSLSKKNNVSKTIILKAMHSAFSALDINEQNRLLFEAIKNK